MMGKAMRFSQYICPLGKWDGICPGKIGSKKKDYSKADVTGRYCKNNCSEYKSNECPRFER